MRKTVKASFVKLPEPSPTDRNGPKNIEPIPSIPKTQTPLSVLDETIKIVTEAVLRSAGFLPTNTENLAGSAKG